ncbi:MAG: hypothetical protein ACKVP0_19680 [Pirellulaceae bacterium]
MNTAACLASDVDVLPLESCRGGSASLPPEETGTTSPPPVAAGTACPTVPSDRDLQIYEAAVFAGRSQRDVAREFGVSQPRVNQILKEIAAWMADNTPSFCSGLTPEQKLRLVNYNVVQQLEYQRCSLMQAWEESRHGTETVSRTTIVNGVRRTTAVNRPCRANARYVDAAARVSLSIAKLSGWTPAATVTDAPQDSPWWQVGEQGTGDRGQETAGGRQSAVGSGQADASRVDLSPAEERAANPNLTRAEMDAITAEQEAVCAALQAQVEELESKIRERGNSLSPGSGPLLPEEGNGASRSRKQDKKPEQRREFLREEPTITNIRDAFGRKTPLSG